MTLISAALSHQNHINYFRAFFLDERRARIISKKRLLLSRFPKPLAQVCGEVGCAPAAGFGTSRDCWGSFTPSHSTANTSLALPLQSSWQRILSLLHSQQITANFQALGISFPLKIKYCFLLHTNSTLISSIISFMEV